MIKKYLRNYYCKCGNKISYSSFKYGKQQCRSCHLRGNKHALIHGNSLTIFRCIDCNKQLNIQAYYDKTKRCSSCYHKLQKNNKKRNYCIDCEKEISLVAKRCNPCAHKGKNHPSFSLGKYCTQHYCIDCNKKITSDAIRCKKCANTKTCLEGKSGCRSKHIRYKGFLMKSSWEIVYAKWLDKQNIKWLYESKTFDLGNTTYTPDFYLPETEEYIEIKGYWRDDAKKKFNLFKKKFKDIKILIYNELKLKKLGVI